MYLPSLKMDYEGLTMLGKKSAIPRDLNWSLRLSRDGKELEAYPPMAKTLMLSLGLISGTMHI